MKNQNWEKKGKKRGEKEKEREKEKLKALKSQIFVKFYQIEKLQPKKAKKKPKFETKHGNKPKTNINYKTLLKRLKTPTKPKF